MAGRKPKLTAIDAEAIRQAYHNPPAGQRVTLRALADQYAVSINVIFYAVHGMYRPKQRGAQPTVDLVMKHADACIEEIISAFHSGDLKNIRRARSKWSRFKSGMISAV